MRLLGISRDEYLERFDRANLCTYNWRAETAHRNATLLLLHVPPTQAIAVFGPRVAHAFELNYIPFTAKGRFRILPHLGKGARTGWEFEENVERTKRLLGL